jgi:CubicO group peptidase (beta-lactamase class C family)
LAAVVRRLALVALAALSAGCVSSQLHVVSGMVSHTLCAEVFVTGLTPERAYEESIAGHSGMELVGTSLDYVVDAERRQVSTTIAGRFASRAVYRPGLGCLLLREEEPPRVTLPREPLPPPLLPEIAGPAVVEPTNPLLVAALERAFEESDPPGRYTRAVVVAHRGRVVAERYAPGIGPETRLMGYSATKGVMNALVGILVREKKLALDAPAAVPAWSGPHDERRTITPDHLLRMTSGLAAGEVSGPSSPTAKMLFLEPDMAAFAASARLAAEPGTRWQYASPNALILAGIVRRAAGGRAEDVLALARRELFGPLGMTSAVLELDVAGNPVGSTYLFASARDWLRFGLLYLQDGSAGGRRILPEGWVKRSTTPTLDTSYGAGFWLNRVDATVYGATPRWSIPGAPADTFYAGGLLGQYVAVVPSRQLVIARFGPSVRSGGDVAGLGRLIDDVSRALGETR